MGRFIRSVVVQDETPAADGSYTYDLPVNPISHINLSLKALNVTDEATLAELLAMIPNIEVLHRGSSIIQCSAADLLPLDAALLRNLPILTNQVATDNATRSLGLIVPFGRKLFNPAECFPEAKSGELKLRLTVDIANAGADGLIIQAEVTELLGAAPTRYLKYTTLTKTPSATGQCDVPLPIAYAYAAIMLWGTTVPTGTAWTATIDQVKLLADNTELLYSLANWESLHADLVNRIGHRPGYTVAAANDNLVNYALMDFDPALDDQFLLDSKAFNSLTLRVIAGDTNPLRVLPLELVPGII